MRKSKFKVILSNQENKELDVEYELHDSILAEKWIKKIKHLKRVAINPIESQIVDVSNLQSIYNEFCEFANLQPIDI